MKRVCIISIIFILLSSAYIGSTVISKHNTLGKVQQTQFAFQKTSSFIDESNIMHVYGEVRNLSNNAMQNVVIKASFYDSNGKLINQFERSSDIRTINPGQISPFEILYIDTKSVNNVKNYTLSATGQETKIKQRELKIISNSSKLDLLGVYYIAGRVMNEGSQDTTNSMIIATLYDKDGRVIVVGRAQTEPVNISSHTVAAFDLPVTEQLQTYKVKSYSLAADSDQYVTVPEFSHLTATVLLVLMFTIIITIDKIKHT